MTIYSIFTSAIDAEVSFEDSGNAIEDHQGSWLPSLVVVIILIIRWFVVGTGNIPVRVRKWVNSKVNTGNRKRNFIGF